MYVFFIRQYIAIQRHVSGFALIVEFLAQPCCHFTMDFARVDGFVIAAIESKDKLELA